MNQILEFLKPDPPYNEPEKFKDFIKDKTIVPVERPRTYQRVKLKRLPDFEMSPEMIKKLEKPKNEVREMLSQVQLNPDNYKDFFTNLLYAEEYETTAGFKIYDRQETTLERYEDYLTLNMPGLAEERPSVVPGNFILVVKCGLEDKKAYKGYVRSTRVDKIDIKFGRKFMQEIYSPDAKFNVRFTYNRISMRRMHQALNNDKMNFRRLFPHNHENYRRNGINDENNDQLTDFYTAQNYYQKQAVRIIKTGEHHPLPFIIFGPPGTGKSATVVEAILQLRNDDKNRILACAASNAAANLLLRKLSEYLSPEEMIRIYAVSQKPNKLDSDLHRYCVINNGKFQVPTLTYIEERKVVVTTCITAGLLHALGRTKPYTHIFVDEAGQALEPEILTALQNGTKDTKIILAGDPKQLGPFVYSKIAKDHGLGQSLIERLVETSYYDFSDTCKYGVKLLINYRTHPSILNFPNATFYEGALQPCDDLNNNSLINFSYLPKKGYPLMFWKVEGKENREGQSPSWFNAHEAGYVLAVVKQLLKEDVKPEDIGIISPYVKQREKISKLLKHKEINGVEIGTVEKFQGQERRVIIISTVRTRSARFFGEPGRVCVALTRAQELLIVIGDPSTLTSNELWEQWLEEVRVEGGHSEVPFPENVW
ncbi:12307_t:CDS:2 [Dentiscutata erythropus]|uniref:RNA helicase n=1 Tax=Dentiscutata erythropus TaxID=1348616 RepID=A0A9N8ZWB7_9GLOM|nr:12307_t:CDS:2 [Dentiscutata erythropus]